MDDQDTISTRPVAIVTGVSRGFGRSVAQALIADGWVVVGDSRNDLAVPKQPTEASGEHLHFIRGDITDQSHLDALVSAAESLGNLMLLVNSAGALGPSPLPALAVLPAADFESLFRVNTVAPLQLIQRALPKIAANSGVVINVSSDAAVEPYPGWGGYGATKAALEKVTSVLAVESPGVRFYALDPGDMRTDMHQAAFPGEDISDRQDPAASAPAVVKLAGGLLPSGRYRAKDLLG